MGKVTKAAKPVTEKKCIFEHYRQLSQPKEPFAWPFEAYEGPVRVESEQVEKAVAALLDFSEKKSTEQKMLFEDNARSLTLVFGISGIPKHFEGKPYFIELPVPLYNDATEACLFTKDPQRKYKDMLDKDPVPAVKKVLGVKKLQERYKTPAQRKELVNSFELFLCDKETYGAIHGYCGKEIVRKKWPVPVKLSTLNTRKHIERVLKCTWFRTPTGPSIAVRVGRCDWSKEDIVKNIAAVIPRVASVFEGKHKMQVNGICLNATDCPVLQIYARTTVERLVETDAAEVKERKEKRKEKRRSEAVEEVEIAAPGAVAPASESEDELVPAAKPVNVVVKEPKKRKGEKKGGEKKKRKAA